MKCSTYERKALSVSKGNYSHNDGNKSENNNGRVMILVHCTSLQ